MLFASRAAKAIFVGNASLADTAGPADTAGGADTASLASPQPTYSIKYLVPTSTPIYFIVNIANNSSLPANIVTLVQNAVLAAFNGTDGGARARIASALYPSRYYAGIAALSPFVSILSVFLGQAASPSTVSTTLGVDQAPTLQASNIAVNLV